MSNYAQGKFTPKNPQKYIGANVDKIYYRSSWELTTFSLLDDINNVGIIAWASESIAIPYKNPLTNKMSSYIPDLFVVSVDSKNNKHCDLIEIKPEKETPGFKGKMSARDRLAQAINGAKFIAAMKYCAARGWKFRVLTEKQLFAFKRK